MSRTVGRYIESTPIYRISIGRKEEKEKKGKSERARTCQRWNSEREVDILNIAPPNQNQNTKIELDFSLLKEGNSPKVPTKAFPKDPTRKISE